MEIQTKPRRLIRWVKRLLIGAAIIFIVFILLSLIIRAWIIHNSDKRYQALVAELNESDPEWRWEDILAQRGPIPCDENSGTVILAAGELFAFDWPRISAAE